MSIVTCREFCLHKLFPEAYTLYHMNQDVYASMLPLMSGVIDAYEIDARHPDYILYPNKGTTYRLVLDLITRKIGELNSGEIKYQKIDETVPCDSCKAREGAAA